MCKWVPSWEHGGEIVFVVVPLGKDGQRGDDEGSLIQFRGRVANLFLRYGFSSCWRMSLAMLRLTVRWRVVLTYAVVSVDVSLQLVSPHFAVMD